VAFVAVKFDITITMSTHLFPWRVRLYSSRLSSREIGFRCMKLQNPPLVHSLQNIQRTNSTNQLQPNREQKTGSQNQDSSLVNLPVSLSVNLSAYQFTCQFISLLASLLLLLQ